MRGRRGRARMAPVYQDTRRAYEDGPARDTLDPAVKARVRWLRLGASDAQLDALAALPAAADEAGAARAARLARVRAAAAAVRARGEACTVGALARELGGAKSM